MTDEVIELLRKGASDVREWGEYLPLFCLEYPDEASVWVGKRAWILEAGATWWNLGTVTLVPDLREPLARLWAWDLLLVRDLDLYRTARMAAHTSGMDEIEALARALEETAKETT